MIVGDKLQPVRQLEHLIGKMVTFTPAAVAWPQADYLRLSVTIHSGSVAVTGSTNLPVPDLIFEGLYREPDTAW